MKKIASYLLPVLLVLSAVVHGASAYTMDEYRMAVTLAFEIGNAYSDDSVKMVASSIVNRYKALKKRNSKLTYSDIVYQDRQYATGPRGITGNWSQNYSAEALSKLGRGATTEKNWQRCLSIAHQAVTGSLRDYVNGAYSYHKKGLFTKRGGKSEILRARDENILYKGRNIKVDHSFYVYLGGEKMLSLPEHKNYNMNPEAGTDEVSSAYISNTVAAAGENGSGENLCTLGAMMEMYNLGTDDDGAMIDRTGESCWYCKVVIIMVNAYLKVVAAAMGTAQDLGKLILKLGFLIWLAYYLLQQLSSMKPVTPGKMTQDILVMGFKVALAYGAVVMGAALIRDYFLDPVVGTGVDYGMALFEQLNRENGIAAK